MIFYAPQLARAIEQADRVLDVLISVDPSFGRPLGAQITEAIWGSGYRLPSIEGMRPVDPRRVLTADGLREAGIDAAAPFVVIPDVRAGVSVFRFGLTDRRAFESWLDRIGGRDRRRIAIGAESASVLALDSERPITCLPRHTQAICQLGASAGTNPVAHLERAISAGGPTYSRLAGVLSAYQRLPRDGVAYAFFSPGPLARDAAWTNAAHERRRTRFGDARARAAAEEQIRQTTARLFKWSRWIEGGAAAVIADERAGVQVQLTPSGIGRRLIAEALPERTTADLIGRWADTPALFSVLVHADPGFVQRAALGFGFDLPKDVLTGTIGLLGLGLDSECPSAKRGSSRELDWAFLVPSALTVGLATAAAADRVQHLLSERFTVTPLRKTPWISDARPPIAGLAAGSPYEIHVLDGMMIVGTGVGSGAAALRRLASITRLGPEPERAPFLRAAVHPRAIDAAFAAGAFGRDHRRELLAIEALRLQLKPVLERIDAVTLEASASEDHEHVALDLVVK